MKKGNTSKKKMKYLAAAILSFIALTIGAGIFFACLQKEDDSHLDVFKVLNEPTDLKDLKLEKEFVKFIEKNEVSHETYHNIANVNALEGEQYLIYLYGTSCSENCLNENIISRVAQLENNGEIVYTFDINKVSDLYLSILLQGVAVHTNANFIYINNKNITDIISLDTHSDLNNIPNKDNNSSQMLLELESSDNKEEFLKKHYKNLYPEYTDGEINDLVVITLKKYQINNK